MFCIISVQDVEPEWISVLRATLLQFNRVILSLYAASVQLPWQRAVSQNKVPYYIK